MQSRHNMMDSRLDLEPMHKCANGRRFGAAGMSRFCGFGWIRMLAMVVVFLLSVGSAFGQYGQFTVTPMKIEAQITPGKTLTTTVTIQNLDPNSSATFDLTLVELSQSEKGDWMMVDPNLVNDPNAPEYKFDLSRLHSCLSWIHPSKTVVALGPSQFAPVEITIRPRRAKLGFHTAGIVATARPRPGMTGLGMTVRFLIPVVVEIESRPIRAKVKATDVGLRFVPASGGGPATTMVTMSIENDGGTLSQLLPMVRIHAFSKNRWRLITTTQFANKRIIPGARITLEADALKSLPTGKYKVHGELFVDGRRTRPVEKIIDFKGDPRIDSVLADAPLDLKPLDLTIECAPGSLRSETITVYNAADEPVLIQTAKGLPPQLQQLVVDDIKGTDLDCTSWLQISPETFTLRGAGGRQNVQVVAKLPAGVTHPCYYSLLALWATYPDGQRAGVQTANIFLKNSEVSAEPAAQAMPVRLQELGDSRYLVTATFRNLKIIHFKPITVKAGLIAAGGVTPILSTYLSGDPRPMLPFETRTFYGDLDLSNIAAGRYLLSGRIEYAPGQTEMSNCLIDVSIQGDRRVVQILGTQIELGEAIQVNW